VDVEVGQNMRAYQQGIDSSEALFGLSCGKMEGEPNTIVRAGNGEESRVRENHNKMLNTFQERDFNAVRVFDGTYYLSWVDNFIIQIGRVNGFTSCLSEEVLSFARRRHITSYTEFISKDMT
jgi:hypothetical protein